MDASKADPASAALLKVEGLDLGVAGHSLLRSARFEVHRGECVVLLGPSGTGKSVLLKLIAGVLRPGRRGLRADGTLHFDGEDLLRRTAARGRVGLLFQNPALFDEWTPLQNVRFAERQRRSDRSGPEPKALLEGLGVRPRARIRTLSGGQQQRVALARALALAPDLLLYDEPTTGLDPANSRKVARLIDRTHRDSGTAALIVSHDVETLVEIADRVLLLDPSRGCIEEIPGDQARQRLHELDDGLAANAPPPSAYFGRRALEGTADFVLGSLMALAHLVPTTSPRDLARFGRRWARLCSSLSALLYFAVAGAVVGFVATYFTFEHLPKRGFTEPLFIDDILRALGFLMYRVLCPVILTLLIAARTGAAIASEVGNKSYAGQLDAMRSLGASPSRHLLTTLLWTVLLSTPLLYAAHFLAARSVSLGAFVYGHSDQTAFYWDRNFHRSLHSTEGWAWIGSGWLLLKLELCAFGTAALAWFHGVSPKTSAQDVSDSVTRTIIAASLWVLFVHLALSFLEF